MAEYYAVLSKAIAGLTNASPETRRAVYDKARNALISQLRAIDPPLPTSEISRQRLELEEAIRRVEREIQSGTLPPPPARPVQQTLPSPPPQEQLAPPPPAATAGRRSPQDIFRQAILDAEGRGWTAQGPAAQDTPAAAGGGAPDRPRARPPFNRAAPPTRVDLNEEVPELPPDVDGRDGYVPPTVPEAAPARGYGAGRATNGPQLAPDYGYDRGDEELPQPPVDRARDMRRGPAPIDPEIDEVPPPPPPPPAKRRWGRRKEQDDGYAEPAPTMAAAPVEGRRRRSRVPLLLLLFLVLTGGAAFAAWTQLPTIKAIIASFDVPAPKPPATATLAVPDTALTASTKNGDRLLPPGASAPAPAGTAARPATTPPAAPAPAASTTPGVAAADKPAVRIVGPEPPATTGPAGSSLAPPSSTAPKPATPTTGGQQATLAPPATSTGPAAPAGQTLTQKAVLYEEPTDPAVAATSTIMLPGTVSWAFVATGPDGPTVVGTVTIPERKLKVKITIRRNTDKSLPASHLVELNVDPLTADFPGKAIQTVPSMVFKSTEDGRGDVLIGASATISTSPGFYWIALSNAQRDMTSNLGLLRDRGWIDIRLVYSNNQRAILTLEKGPAGETAFTKALAAWQTG